MILKRARVIASREDDELRLLSIELVLAPPTAATVVAKLQERRAPLQAGGEGGWTQLLEDSLDSPLYFAVAIPTG